MRRLLVIICAITALAGQPVRAELASITFDKKVTELLSSTLGAQAKQENTYSGRVEDITKNYEAIVLSSTGIFTQKYLERKAMTNLEAWGEENRYYHLIYNLCYHDILPCLITTTIKCAADPSTALFWGSYIAQTGKDIKDLCATYETVCAGGKVSFATLPFVELKEEFQRLTDLPKKIGESLRRGKNTDWKEAFGDIFSNLRADFLNRFNKETISKDLEELAWQAADLAASGLAGGVLNVIRGGRFNDAFAGKGNELRQLVCGFDYDSGLGDMAREAEHYLDGTKNMKPEDIIAFLFQPARYNINEYISNYLANMASDRCYTQKWYIYSVSPSSTTTIRSYTPTPLSAALATEGGGKEWHVENTDWNTPEFSEASINKTDEYLRSIWGGTPKELYKDDKRYTYLCSYEPVTMAFKEENLLAGACKVTVIRERGAQRVYEETYDSNGDITEAAFKSHMEAKCMEFTNKEEENLEYKIGKEEKLYYDIVDEDRAMGASECKIYAECIDKTPLASGSIAYKCWGCKSKKIGDHVKECSMKTSLDAVSSNAQEEKAALAAQYTKVSGDIASVNRKIAEIQSKQSAIWSQLSGNITPEQRTALKAEYENLTIQLQALEEEKGKYNLIYDSLRIANSELSQELAEADEWNRIPAKLAEIGSAYGISWNGDATWTKPNDKMYVYTVTGRVVNNGLQSVQASSMDNKVEFRAEVKYIKKPKYVLGIHLGHARIGIDYAATHIGKQRSLVETMTLSPEGADSLDNARRNADAVNKRLAELRDDYPDCTLSTEFKYEGEKRDSTDDVFHILWPSDRLGVARDVYSQLIKIYADLIILNKFMGYKATISDWIHALIPINYDIYRHRTIPDSCLTQWRLRIRQNSNLHNPLPFLPGGGEGAAPPAATQARRAMVQRKLRTFPL